MVDMTRYRDSLSMGPLNQRDTFGSALTKGSTLICRLRFSWNFQNIKIGSWKDSQAQSLLPEFIFSTLKTALKLNTNVNSLKIAYILEWLEISQNHQNYNLRRWVLVDYMEWLLFLNYVDLKKCQKLNAIFKLIKIDFGSMIGAWVSFHTVIFQSWKLQENLGRTFVVLPL